MLKSCVFLSTKTLNYEWDRKGVCAACGKRLSNKRSVKKVDKRLESSMGKVKLVAVHRLYDCSSCLWAVRRVLRKFEYFCTKPTGRPPKITKE